MKPRNGLAAAALALVAMPLAACASVDRSAPLRAFEDGRYGAARAAYEAALSEHAENQALDHNDAGTVALVQGDVEAAHRHFRAAYTIMDDLTSTTGETLGAIVGPESSKTWKGDPYERCMNAYYLGVTYWMQGDADNAAACFNAGLLRDGDSATGAARSDFGVLWFLLGMAQREAMHEDRGEFALKRAHEVAPKNPWLDPSRCADANVVVVVELGRGPLKVASGAHGSVVTFRRARFAEAYAEVFDGTASLGRTARAADLHHQATTRGEKVIDHINQGKAVFKDAAVIGGAVVLGNSGSTSSDLIGVGMIVAGLLTPSEADTRQWDTLPGEIHVLTAKLAPGEHDLRIDVRSASDQTLPDGSKTLRVTAREGRTSFVWMRALPAEAPSRIGEARMGAP